MSRPTTCYMVTVRPPLGESTHRYLDRMILRAQKHAGGVDQSGVNPDQSVFVRVRLKTDDDLATETAGLISDGQVFVLSTGYGVHHRVIN